MFVCVCACVCVYVCVYVYMCMCLWVYKFVFACVFCKNACYVIPFTYSGSVGGPVSCVLYVTAQLNRRNSLNVHSHVSMLHNFEKCYIN